MSVLTSLTRVLRRPTVKESPIAYSPYGASFGIPPRMNAQAYLQMYGSVGWLFGAVSRIAESVAETQWSLYNIKKDDREVIPTHPLLDLLDYVNPFMTGMELIELHQMYMELMGESFWILARNGSGPPREIWPVPPNRMKIVPDAKEYIKGYVYQHGAQTIPLEVNEVIFIKRPNPADPYRGIGPAQSIGIDTESEYYAAQWNRNFFFNNATPAAVITYPNEVTEPEYERLRTQWDARHRGIGNAHKIAILSSGAKVETIAISQKDMDFWRQRKINRDNILGAFGIPASVMGISENVNRANAESGEYVFARWCIKPRLTRLREKLNEHLVPMFGDGIELDYEDPVPENIEQDRMTATEGVKNGILTVNEARQLLGYDILAGGDVFLMPMGVTQIGAGTKNWIEVLPRVESDEPRQIVRHVCQHEGLFAGEDQKDLYWQKFAKDTEQQEKPVITAMKGLFADQEKLVLSRLRTAKKPEDALFPSEPANRQLKKTLQPLLEKVMEVAILQAEDLIKPRPAHTDAVKQDPVVSGDALEWLLTHVDRESKLITKTTRQLLRDTLAEGFAEGEDIPTLAARVQSIFDTAKTSRAVMIARTEVINASAEGHIKGYERAGVEKVEFYAALDERLCPECEALHGGTFDINNSEGIITVHQNCRCIWLPIIE